MSEFTQDCQRQNINFELTGQFIQTPDEAHTLLPIRQP